MNSGGRLVFHIFGALTEFERGVIKERTMAGLKAAKDMGRTGGRPASLKIVDLIVAKALPLIDSLKILVQPDFNKASFCNSKS